MKKIIERLAKLYGSNYITIAKQYYKHSSSEMQMKYDLYISDVPLQQGVRGTISRDSLMELEDAIVKVNPKYRRVYKDAK